MFDISILQHGLAEIKCTIQINHCSACKEAPHANEVDLVRSREDLRSLGLSKLCGDWNFQVRHDHIINFRNYPDNIIADIGRLGGTDAVGQRQWHFYNTVSDAPRGKIGRAHV